MRTVLVVGSGVLMAVSGGTWTMQGLGYLGGSPMSGVAVWAIVGPLVAGLGVALVIVGLGGGRRGDR